MSDTDNNQNVNVHKKYKYVLTQRVLSPLSKDNQGIRLVTTGENAQGEKDQFINDILRGLKIRFSNGAYLDVPEGLSGEELEQYKREASLQMEAQLLAGGISEKNIKLLFKHYSQKPAYTIAGPFQFVSEYELASHDTELLIYQENNSLFFEAKRKNFYYNYFNENHNQTKSSPIPSSETRVLYKLTSAGFVLQDLSTNSNLLVRLLKQGEVKNPQENCDHFHQLFEQNKTKLKSQIHKILIDAKPKFYEETFKSNVENALNDTENKLIPLLQKNKDLACKVRQYHETNALTQILESNNRPYVKILELKRQKKAADRCDILDLACEAHKIQLKEKLATALKTAAPIAYAKLKGDIDALLAEESSTNKGILSLKARSSTYTLDVAEYQVTCALQKTLHTNEKPSTKINNFKNIVTSPAGQILTTERDSAVVKFFKAICFAIPILLSAGKLYNTLWKSKGKLFKEQATKIATLESEETLPSPIPASTYPARQI